MKLKRFIAKDMSSAMRDVRETLGPDAIILSDKTVPQGVEVTAAIDYENTPLNNTFKQSSTASNTGADATGQSPNWLNLNAMQTEITALRGLLEKQLAGLVWQNKQTSNPIQAMALEKLSLMGFSAVFCQQLIAGCQFDEVSQLTTQIEKNFSVLVPTLNQNIADLKGTYAFVGPTGVGKTTTLAKIAARFALRNSADKLGIITTDTYRIAAQQQLTCYGKLLGVNVRHAENADELAKCINRLKDKDLILIDTFGLSQRDEHLNERLQTLTSCGHAIKPVLVLPATTQARVLEQTYQAFKPLNLEAAVITKVDEAAEIGGAIDVCHQNDLPVAFITNGQKVPEDILLARSNQLLELAQSIASENQTILSEEEMAKRFSELGQHGQLGEQLTSY
jgi:flagellar biosynthesis protein FlhF